MLMFNSHYIVIEVISIQTVIIVSHSHLLQGISKQEAIMGSRCHPRKLLAPTFCPFYPLSTLTI